MKTEEQVKGLFELAGIEVLGIWKLFNGLWPVAPSPWWLVETKVGLIKVGPIKVGPQKWVFSLEWGDTPIRAVITGDAVTKDYNMVRASTLPKLLEYLMALAQKINLLTGGGEQPTGDPAPNPEPVKVTEVKDGVITGITLTAHTRVPYNVTLTDRTKSQVEAELSLSVGIYLVDTTTPDGPWVYVAARKGEGDFFNYIETPGGTVNPLESIRHGAVRELKEETGLVIDENRLVALCRPIKTQKPLSRSFYLANWFYVRLKTGEIPQDTEPDKRTTWERTHLWDIAENKIGHRLMPNMPSTARWALERL